MDKVAIEVIMKNFLDHTEVFNSKLTACILKHSCLYHALPLELHHD